MISPETIRRYDFFSGLNMERIVDIAKVSKEMQLEEGAFCFRENDELGHLYLVEEGRVGITVNLPDSGGKQRFPGHLLGHYPTSENVASVVHQGEVFGWSSLIPPHRAVAGACALVPCELIAIDMIRLRACFERDWHFGYQMVQKAAGVVRERMRDLRLETITLEETT